MTAWGKRTLCLVTGASQGIGREVAIQFSQKISLDSTIILTARSERGLSETTEIIHKHQPNLDVKIFPYDMSCPKTEDFSKLLKNYNSTEWDLYLLVHNAGTEGSGRPLVECCIPEEWQQYMSLNLYSMTSLTSAFLKTFMNAEKTIIVNITSLAAIQPITGLGEYCVGKAAREMYLKVLSEESPKLRVFSYSPGPVNTDMIGRCIDKIDSTGTKGMFENMKNSETLVKPADTVNKLVKTIDNGLPSYLRVDYFDRD